MAHVDRVRGLLLGLLVSAATSASGAEPPPPARVAPTLILVSMDTTRADALGCYGALPGFTHPRPDPTPVLDALARDGARFERFYAEVPSTLASHATMMTGRDPHRTGIPRNGFPLDPSEPTLAERLAGAGYDTIAVIGAAPLEPAMGLDRGFRVYDARFSVKLGPQFQDPADGVVRRALEDVDARREGEPLFLFVHFFDAHQPYTPPARVAARLVDPAYTGPAHPVGFGDLRTALIRGRADPADVDHVAALYQAEVSFVDEQIGVLLDGLRARGLLEHAVVVVTADHGEVLGEVPAVAWSHGNDVTDGSTHVPLIVRGYGVPLAERAVVHRQAEMSGLASTLEALVGLEPTLGAPFDAFVRPGPVRDEDGWPLPTRPVFQEATRPYATSGTEWNNLGLRRGVRAGGYVATAFPSHGEPLALIAGPPVVLPVLRELLDRWDAGAPPWRDEHLSGTTAEALRALGYVDDDPGDH